MTFADWWNQASEMDKVSTVRAWDAGFERALEIIETVISGTAADFPDTEAGCRVARLAQKIIDGRNAIERVQRNGDV